MDPKAEKIFEKMIERGLIPSHGQFEITDELLTQSFLIFRELFPPCRERMPSQSEVRQAKKIAGLNMMRLNELRIASQEEKTNKKIRQECGFVYVVSNPVFPDLFKIGMTTDVEKRLSTYQTSDPHRKFKVERSIFVKNRRTVEADILAKLKMDVVNGEWVSASKLNELLKKIEWNCYQ